MCTVVCRWQPEDQFPVQLLALRDELASRDFDLPGTWWPEHPGLIGGRDRSKGGTWCVSDVASGTTAVVLNNPRRRIGSPDTPSRGVLPLLAIQHAGRWTEHIDTRGMAGFNLVLASPESLQWWTYDGEFLVHQELTAGTYMFTPMELRIADFGDDRLLHGHFHPEAGLDSAAEQAWAEWIGAVRDATPSTDPIELLVRRPHENDSYETVFAQCIAADGGLLRLDYLNRPVHDQAGKWHNSIWSGPPHQ